MRSADVGVDCCVGRAVEGVRVEEGAALAEWRAAAVGAACRIRPTQVV